MPTPAAPPSSVEPGRAFGKYVIKRLVAEGGMAVVFEAVHSKLDQRVAIKLLNRNLMQRPDVVGRFEREARAAARIVSPYVVRVIDVDATEEGRPYIVMEYLEGRDLEEEIRHRAPLPAGDAVAYILEAAAAVSTAHRAGIVHRDIKPANIFVSDERTRKVIKVLDFGISKIDSPQEVSATSTQTMLGTPLYMSPEQVRSARDVDGRTDVWSLGVVLYEMLSGQLPFLAEEASAVIAAIVSDPITPIGQLRPDLPPPLAAAVMKALEKDRNQRFRLVDDFAAALLPFAPPWFRPPAAPISTRTPRPLLPAQLSNSLADSLDDDRTIADPDAAPDALRPPAVSGFEPTAMAPSPANTSQPSGVTRTTAGGDKKKPTSDATRLVLAILLGIIAASMVLAAAVLVTRSRRAAADPSALDTANGELEVAMSNGSCAVRVDGVDRGTTPVLHLSLPPGTHTVTCGTMQQRVTIEPRVVTRIKF